MIPRSKLGIGWSLLLVAAMLSSILVSCATPTPQVVKEVVTAPPQVITTAPQVVKEVVTATPVPAPTQMSTPKAGGTLVIGLESAPVGGLDPHLTTSYQSLSIYENIYGSLLTLDDKMQLVPDLAVSWDTPDPKTYIFHLRQGVLFHNGREFVADDVKYSFERLIDPKTAAPLASWYASIASIEVVDKYTVKFNLKQPDVWLLSNLAHRRPSSIIPKEVVEQNGDLKNVAVGTGPFMLAEWVPGSRAVLKRNPNYYKKGLPYLDQITFNIIPEERSRLAALRAGQVDLTKFLEPKTALVLENNPDVVVKRMGGQWRTAIVLNTKVKPFDDVRVRQAVSLAIDRNQILNSVFAGYGALTGVVPPDEPWTIPVSDLFGYTPDLAKAKQLMADAGYPNGYPDKIPYMAASTYPTDVDTAMIVQSMLKQIGINVDLNIQEYGAIIAAETSHNFTMMAGDYTGRPNPDLYIGPMYYTGTGTNAPQYDSAEMNALLDKGRQTADDAARKVIYQDAQKLAAQDAPIIWLTVLPLIEGMQPYVRDYYQLPNGYRLALEQVWLAK